MNKDGGLAGGVFFGTQRVAERFHQAAVVLSPRPRGGGVKERLRPPGSQSGRSLNPGTGDPVPPAPPRERAFPEEPRGEPTGA